MSRVTKELSRVVLSLREGAGLTQAALGKAAGVDASTISLIENGKLEPLLTTFFRLAEGLGVDPPSLALQVYELTKAGRPMVESWQRS
jgi:transcriptional regulator with XRE-family HTH domain